MLALCIPPVIMKVRHRIEHSGRVWEVDVFSGANEGLVVAEVELPSEDAEDDLPSWIGDEVTDRLALLQCQPGRAPIPGVALTCGRLREPGPG